MTVLLNQGGIFARLFAYSIIFVFLTSVISFGLIISKTDFGIDISNYVTNKYIGYAFAWFIFSLPALTIILLKEWSIRKFRRKNNLSIYKNITPELVSLETLNFSRKENNDLNYWYDLKEKGAITSEEYESKKQELLN